MQGKEIPKESLILKKPDKALLSSLVGGHAKVPLEFLYLEAEVIYARFILACRRIIYLQTILRKDDMELVKQIYTAQQSNSRNIAK